jgi:thioredoxin 1
MTTTVNVTDSSFDQLIRSNELVLVDFWAPWCGPCRLIAPILEQLADEMKGKAVVAKLNVDENPIAPTRYQIRGIPTLKLFYQGKEAHTFVGLQPLHTLKSAMLRYDG